MSDPSPHATTALPARIPSLDGLRGISILLVLLGHLAGTRHAPAFLDAFHQLGNWGVRVFFIISGFLITSLLLAEHRRNDAVSLVGFYRRRAVRILPAYLALVATVAMAERLGWLHLVPGDLLHALTFTTNYHHERSWWLNHTWSLAVEEQFYLLWPFVLVLLGMRGALWAASLALFAAPACRAWMWWAGDASPSAMTREFQAVADALATGCVLAFATPWIMAHRDRLLALLRGWRMVALVGAVFALPMILFRIDAGLFYVPGQTLTNLLLALVIVRVVVVPDDRCGRIVNAAPFVWLGALSYSLYLWQELFLNSWELGPLQSFPLNVVATFAAALLSYHLVERPFLTAFGRTRSFRGALATA